MDKIDKIISIIKEEGGMTTCSTAGKPGFSNAADDEGPVAGRDPLMFAKPIKRKPKDIKSDWISYLTRRSYKKTLG